MSYGTLRPLDDNDITKLMPNDQAEFSVPEFLEALDAETERLKASNV